METKKTISYYPKGTTVYYFNGLELSLKETIVENVSIEMDADGFPIISYKLDSDKKNVPHVYKGANQVFSDIETLKKQVLSSFAVKEKDAEVKAPVS